MITCWLCHKIASTRAETNTALPDWVRNHVQKCSACRRTYEADLMVVQSLSSTPIRCETSLSPLLQGRIMRAIRSDEILEAPTLRFGFSSALAAIAVCLVAVGLIWLSHPVKIGPGPEQLAPPAADLALNVNLPSVSQVDQWTKTLDAPLEQETKLVLLDAVGAINTLARGFLPKDLLASSGETVPR
jgi:hypothetical protein